MILSISGLARSGKDTVGAMLIKRYGFKRVAMADCLKEVTAKVMDKPLNTFYADDLKDKNFDKPIIFDDTLADNLAYELNQLGIDVTPSKFKDFIGEPFENPRKALVFIGTDLCRNLVDEEIWLNLTLNKIQKMEGHIVITDARFKNERQAIKNLGGITMFIDRPSITKSFDASKAHISELDQLNDSYDVQVLNNTTVHLLELEIDMWFNAKVRTLR